MELNEMEKCLIFQTEDYEKSDVTYELRMCLTDAGYQKFIDSQDGVRSG